jgi:hypothetical protein
VRDDDVVEAEDRDRARMQAARRAARRGAGLMTVLPASVLTGASYPDEHRRRPGERPPVLQLVNVGKTYPSTPPVNALRGVSTNLLTVTDGQTFFGQPAELPMTAPSMIGRIGSVEDVQHTGTVHADVYRSNLIPAIDTNALSVRAATVDLLPGVGTSVAHSRYLNAATARQPVAVLGAVVAQRLGIDQVLPGERVLVGGQWLYVAGILNPAVLAPAIDNTVVVGYPATRRYLGFDGRPSTVYVRTHDDHVNDVHALLAATADPQAPYEVNVSRPSDALVARAQAKSALNGLFLGLGAVSLPVGAVGVANIMIISVLECQSEIGLRRAREQRGAISELNSSARRCCSYCSAEPSASASAWPPPPGMRTPSTGPSSSPPSPGPADSARHCSSARSPACCQPCGPPAWNRPRPCGRSDPTAPAGRRPPDRVRTG